MNSRNELLFSFPGKDVYYFDHLDSERINYSYTLLKKRGHQFLRRIYCFLLPFISWIPGIERLNDRVVVKHYNPAILSQIDCGGGLVVWDTFLDADLLHYIKRKDVRNKVFIFIWNSIDRKRAQLFSKYVRKENIYSYSKEQSAIYGFNYHNDVLLTSYRLKKLPIKYDFYFLGSGKQREDLLDEFGESLRKGGFKFLFEIWGKANPKFKNITYFTKYQSYEDYLNKVSMSRCLVDFVAHKNITFRTIESFSFGKKLISNNSALKEYNFYNESNILIVNPNDETELETIEGFLKKPLSKIDDEIVKQYDIYGLYDFFADILKSREEHDKQIQ